MLKVLRRLRQKVLGFSVRLNPRGCIPNMDEVSSSTDLVAATKPKYDGRIKKRQWEDRIDEENACKRVHSETVDRVKRKKSVILLGYSGIKYFGMQRNPEMKTVEEELLSALLKANLITGEAFAQVQTINFQRAARTDKGVSAARQVVSLKLPDEVDVIALNNFLPEDIKVFAVKRVTKGFNSKQQCDARTYTYTLPTAAFAHHSETVDPMNFNLNYSANERILEVLQAYEGTKNFHNFTSRKEFFDPSSKRFIISCTLLDVFQHNGMEFTKISIKGQSFMLHQIRKMVGLALAIIRGHTNMGTMEKAWTESRLDIPMAPGLGLVLDQVHYDRYNTRYGSDGIHETLTWEKEEIEINQFAKKYIHENIMNTEMEEKCIMNWLETLPLHSYDVRNETNSEQGKLTNNPLKEPKKPSSESV